MSTKMFVSTEEKHLLVKRLLISSFVTFGGEGYYTSLGHG